MSDLIERQAAIDAVGKIFPAEPLKNEYTQGITVGAALATVYIKQLPSAKLEIIRCRDCEHYSGSYCHYDGRSEFVKPDHFCGYGAKE